MAVIKATHLEFDSLKRLMSEVVIFDHERATCEPMEYIGAAEVEGRKIMAFKVCIKNSDVLFETLQDELESGSSARSFAFRVALISNDFQAGLNIGEIDIFLPYAVFSGKTQHKQDGIFADFYGRLYVSEDAAFLGNADKRLVGALNTASYSLQTPVNLSVNTCAEHSQQADHNGPRPTISIDQILVANLLCRELRYAPTKHRKLSSEHIDLLNDFEIDLNRNASEPWHTLLSKGLELIHGGSRNLADRLMNIPDVTLSMLSKNASAHVAACTGASSLTSWLEYGADLDSRFKDDRTLLMSAASQDKVFQMWQLLSLGADPKLLDQYGNSVLHYMAMNFQNAQTKDNLNNIRVTSSEMALQFAALGAPLGENSQGKTPMTLENRWSNKNQQLFREIIEPFVTQDRLNNGNCDVPLCSSSVQRIRL